MTRKPPVIFARSVGGLLGADFEPDFFSTRFLLLVRDFQDQISTRLSALFILFILFILFTDFEETAQNSVLKKLKKLICLI